MHALQDYADRNGGKLAKRFAAGFMAYLLLVIYVGYGARSDDAVGDTALQTEAAGQEWFEALYGAPDEKQPAAAPAPVAAAPQPNVVVNVAAPTAPAPAPRPVAPVVVRAPAAPPTTRAPAGPRATPNGPSAPTIRITEIEPENPRVGYETRVKFVAGDLDGIVRAYGVDWGDGSPIETVTLPDRCGGQSNEPEHSFPALDHTYDRIGEVDIRVIVYTRGTCDSGALQTSTDAKRINVRPYTPVLGGPPDDNE